MCHVSYTSCYRCGVVCVSPLHMSPLRGHPQNFPYSSNGIFALNTIIIHLIDIIYSRLMQDGSKAQKVAEYFFRKTTSKNQPGYSSYGIFALNTIIDIIYSRLMQDGSKAQKVTEYFLRKTTSNNRPG